MEYILLKIYYAIKLPEKKKPVGPFFFSLHIVKSKHADMGGCELQTMGEATVMSPSAELCQCTSE